MEVLEVVIPSTRLAGLPFQYVSATNALNGSADIERIFVLRLNAQSSHLVRYRVHTVPTARIIPFSPPDNAAKGFFQVGPKTPFHRCVVLPRRASRSRSCKFRSYYGHWEAKPRRPRRARSPVVGSDSRSATSTNLIAL